MMLSVWRRLSAFCCHQHVAIIVFATCAEMHAHPCVIQMRVVDQVCRDPGCACASAEITWSLCLSVVLHE